MSEIFTETPGREADSGPPALYANWYRCDASEASDGEISGARGMTFPADREFWTGLAAAQAGSAALRDSIAALATRLETSACAIHPSRKSDIESSTAAELRKLLEG